MTARKKWVIFGIAGVGLALIATVAVFCNPMLLAFLVSFDIINNSGQDLEIMPIGIMATGEYGPLPRFHSSWPPAIPVDSKKPIRLSATGRVRVTYDYDDINFRSILVRDEQGALYILPTDARGSTANFYGPQQKEYVVPLLKELKKAPSELWPCFDGKKCLNPPLGFNN